MSGSFYSDTCPRNGEYFTKFQLDKTLMVWFGWWGCAKKGLSVDDETQLKARRLLEKSSDKVAYDILKRLADGPRRPAELRAALGIASANFFTARYLTPLAKSGYIAVAGGEKNRYLPGKQYRILRILPHHYGLVRPRSPQVVLRGRSF